MNTGSPLQPLSKGDWLQWLQNQAENFCNHSATTFFDQWLRRRPCVYAAATSCHHCNHLKTTLLQLK